MKYYILCFCFFLVSCKDNYDSSIEVPFYRECHESVENIRDKFSTKYSNTNITLNLEVIPFSLTSNAHPEIAGYVRISSKNMDYKLITIANGLASECYPESALVLDIASTSMEDIKDELSRNERRGIKKSYLRVDGENIYVHSAGDIMPGFR